MTTMEVNLPSNLQQCDDEALTFDTRLTEIGVRRRLDCCLRRPSFSGTEKERNAKLGSFEYEGEGADRIYRRICEQGFFVCPFCLMGVRLSIRVAVARLSQRVSISLSVRGSTWQNGPLNFDLVAREKSDADIAGS